MIKKNSNNPTISIITIAAILGGVVNEGISGFWLAIPSLIVALIILISKEEKLLSKAIIIFGIILSCFVYYSKIHNRNLLHPLNGKELIVNVPLCYSYVGTNLNMFSKFKTIEECKAESSWKVEPGKLLEKGEKVRVLNTRVSVYFLEIKHYVDISTIHGIGTFSDDDHYSGYFLNNNGEVLEGSAMVNQFLHALTIFMLFPFCFIPVLLFYIRSREINRIPTDEEMNWKH